MIAMGLDGKRIVMVLGSGYQDAEASEPLNFLRDRGALVDVVGVSKGPLGGLHGQALIDVDLTFNEADADSYDAMVIPGGRGPASLRKHPVAVDFVRRFAETGRTVAAICHGPQMLAAAGYLKGRTITGYYKIRNEMLEAGANFIDAPVVVDANLITSRDPGDLPDFNGAIEDALTHPA